MSVMLDSAVGLLPNAAHSTNALDAELVRPFGLSRAISLSETDGHVLREYPYDPVRQISLNSNGQPVVAANGGGDDDDEEGGENPGTTHFNTQHDHQWFTDTD